MTSEYKQIVAQARKKKEKETASTEQQLVANQVASQVAGRSVQQKQYQQTAAQQAGTTEQAAGSTGWKYDYENDPTWNAYKKVYREEGRRAAADTLATASAATGGVPSSYAVTASQQARNNYAGKLTELLPTLEQNAYQRYISEQADAYDREQDALDRETAKQTEAYNKALTRLELLGYADAETAQILGLPEGYTLPTESTVTWENSGATDENGNLIYYGSDGSTRVYAPGYTPDEALNEEYQVKQTVNQFKADISNDPELRRMESDPDRYDREVLTRIQAAYQNGALTDGQVDELIRSYGLYYLIP